MMKYYIHVNDSATIVFHDVSTIQNDDNEFIFRDKDGNIVGVVNKSNYQAIVKEADVEDNA